MYEERENHLTKDSTRKLFDHMMKYLIVKTVLSLRSFPIAAGFKKGSLSRPIFALRTGTLPSGDEPIRDIFVIEAQSQWSLMLRNNLTATAVLKLCILSN